MKLFLKATKWLGNHWRGIIYSIVIIAVAIFTLSLHLNSIVQGQNSYESATLANLAEFPAPWHRAVSAPFMVMAYYVGIIINNPLIGARITSVIFSFLAVVCFFFIIRFWFKTRIAIVGSLLFVTSSWLLNISHQATPLALMVFTPLLTILTLIWCLKTKSHKSLAFFSFAVALAFSAYSPYMLWILAVCLIVLLIRARHNLTQLGTRNIIIAALIYLTLLSFLFIALAEHPGQIRELLGIPAQLPSIGGYFSQLLGTLSMLFIYSEYFPILHLDNLPMLDIFSAAMFLLGIYFFIKRLPQRSSLIYLASLVVLILVVAISPAYQLAAAVLLPLIYIAVISGVVELLNRWYSYFPRNPLIRNLGVALVVVAIGFSCYFHLQNYYVAWPNSKDTKAEYVLKSKE